MRLPYDMEIVGPARAAIAWTLVGGNGPKVDWKVAVAEEAIAERRAVVQN